MDLTFLGKYVKYISVPNGTYQGITETLALDFESSIGKPEGVSYEMYEETNSLAWGGISD
jgi:hypothetical protein